MKRKILLQTNAPTLRTGLAENGRILMNWLARRGKYDLAYYCTQMAENDPVLSRLPYRAYGAIPADPNWVAACRGDYGCIRDVHYGGRRILDVVKKERPEIYIGSDDVWAFPMATYANADWFKQINSVLHITVDSVPVSPQAYEQAAVTPHFLAWSEFAVEEMKRVQPKTCAHVDFIYGASDTTKFRPVSPAERAQLRREAGMDPKDTVFIFLGRNQLRKEAGNILHGFAEFKKSTPGARAKLLLHTDWSSEAATQGWDLPRLRDYYQLAKEDVLATHLCRNCRRWEVKPYNGEQQTCRHCGAQKAQVTVNGFSEGVEDDDLYQIYGLADASVSAHTSGALEYTSVNSLLCGLPLACTNYSCGVDFCRQSFVYPIKWHARHEVQSNFIKAANDVYSIRDFMSKVHAMSLDERRAWGAQGREWAERTFSVDAVGTKWETLFDSMPSKDWSTITLGYTPKNEKAPMPDIADAAKWVTSLYQQILLVEPDPDGLKHWLAQLQSGITRDAIYRFFLGRAAADNAQNLPPADFWTLLDRTTGRKRALIVMKESIGDCIILSSLFESFHKTHPGTDLYVATDPKHFEVFAGNPHVFRLLVYHPVMEQELSMIGAGGAEAYFHVFMHPGIQSQRHLNYLSNKRIALELRAPERAI